MKNTTLTVAALVGLILINGSVVAKDDLSFDMPGSDEWNFKVFLDDKEIGYHNFRLSEKDGQRILETEADLKVKILFITAFKYKHSNREVWNDGCLESISSKTNSNKKRFSIEGNQTPDGFIVETKDNSEVMDSCVMTFAYWNPNFLNESSLLNSQTGQIVDVQVTPMTDTSEQSSPSEYQYKVTGEKIDLDVFYSANHRWVGLETNIRKGRKLRYVLD